VDANDGYPADWEADVILSDGTTAQIRPVRIHDADPLSGFFAGLSRETTYLRFLSLTASVTPRELEHLTKVDYEQRMVLLALRGHQIVAVASYDRLERADQAEVGFVVADGHQGHGLATIMLEHLAGLAREHGITRFVAETLAHNARMLRVFQDAGFDEEARFDDGVVRVALSLEKTARAVAAIDERDRRAAARSVQRLLRPQSVAVVGASRQPGTIGHEVVRNLLAGGFQGPVYPVNPAATYVRSVRAYPDILAVPEPVDLAVVAVPARAVRDVVAQCGEKGVGGLVVISAGFAEAGQDGAAAERDLVRLAHACGMRISGPTAWV
jgi:predicted CoA-binding protein/L-amino acid N-acyltransferase YncA